MTGQGGSRPRLAILLVLISSLALATLLLPDRSESRAALATGFGDQPLVFSENYSAVACETADAADQDQPPSGGERQRSGPPAAPPPLDTDLSAVRCIADPYPSFNGVAVDPQHGLVALSDTNRKSILLYPRAAGGRSPEETAPARRIMGPKTQIGFVAGVVLDAAHREVVTVNNDIEDTLMAFSYDADGNLVPSRLLAVPHQSWGVALDRSMDQIAVTVQSLDAVVFYRRQATRVEPPVRSILGNNTGLGDPHGLYIDEENKEIVVASHGNRAEGDVSVGTLGETTGGHFDSPSLNVFAESAAGDARPVRTIAGPQTKLNWPMGIALDQKSGEIAVANNGDDSILFFRRTENGDVAPARVIRGSRTGISQPMSVAVDTQDNELWVANFGDHSAVVFDLNAKGNATPKRTIRNAPAGAPTVGFGNPMAIAYDTKRGEILVPN